MNNQVHDCAINNKKKDSADVLFIPAGVLMGMGLGFYYGDLPAGLFIGLGVGFLVFAIITTIKKFKN